MPGPGGAEQRGDSAGEDISKLEPWQLVSACGRAGEARLMGGSATTPRPRSSISYAEFPKGPEDAGKLIMEHTVIN